MMRRIYVCHTYYHVYISILKEFALREKCGDSFVPGQATIVLSKMSNDFESLKDRLLATGYFEDVLEYDEKPGTFFEDLAQFKDPNAGAVKSILNRIKYTKRLGKYQEPYIPTDFSKYDDIYVFCDSDPIGYYLNYKHIYYHSVEDGLDTIKSCDFARKDNTPYFGLKTFLSKRLNLLFVQDGYGRYCRDMEVNDISVLKYPNPYYVECSRKALYDRLTGDEKEFLLNVFVKDKAALEKVLSESDMKTVLVLTEPLAALDVRKRIFDDMKTKYEGEGYRVIFKQHPRDLLDYKAEFPDNLLIDRSVPMEMLNFFDRKFDLVVSVFTELGNVDFAKEKIRHGRDFMDAYEDRAVHESHFESK